LLKLKSYEVNFTMKKKRIFEILEYLTTELKDNLYTVFENYYDSIEEIRIRANKPVIVQTSNGIVELKKKNSDSYIMTNTEIETLFNNICENSRYAYMNEIRNGFVTINGGHRVGIAGKAVCENGIIHNITDINSLNIRIASERIGSGDKAFRYIKSNNEIKSTIIFAPPMVGKTTVLRDIARQISDMGFKVGITDDRGELSGMYRGVPQNDIGKFTDVIENAPKDKAINMLIRSMSPDVIITDEISTFDDLNAVLMAVGTGVKVIATTHGSKPDEVINKPVIKPLITSGEFTQLLELRRRNGISDVIRYSVNEESRNGVTVC